MFGFLFRKKEPLRNREEILSEWEKAGKPFPPPHIIKQDAIRSYATSTGARVLVETGTYLGDMMAAMAEQFRELYSVELSEKLYRRAVKRFRQQPHIHLLQGDSGRKLGELVQKLQEPALFWLDGHYSGGITALGDKECPIPEELAAICASDIPHIILIDDARLFNGTQSYPTLDEVKEMMKKHVRPYSMQVENDIIRLTPQ